MAGETVDSATESSSRGVTIDSRIRVCHQMIEHQCERLAQQLSLGRQTKESTFVLFCLQRSLLALMRARAASDK
jgi:hypothetical protein